MAANRPQGPGPGCYDQREDLHRVDSQAFQRQVATAGLAHPSGPATADACPGEYVHTPPVFKSIACLHSRLEGLHDLLTNLAARLQPVSIDRSPPTACPEELKEPQACTIQSSIDAATKRVAKLEIMASLLLCQLEI